MNVILALTSSSQTCPGSIPPDLVDELGIASGTLYKWRRQGRSSTAVGDRRPRATRPIRLSRCRPPGPTALSRWRGVAGGRQRTGARTWSTPAPITVLVRSQALLLETGWVRRRTPPG